MATKTTPVKVTWSDLNPRQQKYLELIYKVDQENEKYAKSGFSRGYRIQPVSTWRPMPYGDTLETSNLRMYLEIEKLIDEGTGATFESLEKRGLIIRSWKKSILHGLILYVEITAAGRKLIREATGEQRPKKRPVGTLPDYKWKALVEAYQAGKDGLETDGLSGHYNGHDWNSVWLPLRDYKRNGQQTPLVKEVLYRQGYFLEITDEGRALYNEKWQYYRELYPEIEAPEPTHNKL